MYTRLVALTMSLGFSDAGVIALAETDQRGGGGVEDAIVRGGEVDLTQILDEGDVILLALGQAEDGGDEESGEAGELMDDGRVALELHEQVRQGLEEGDGEVRVLASH